MPKGSLYLPAALPLKASGIFIWRIAKCCLWRICEGHGSCGYFCFMPQIHKLIVRNGPPIYYASTFGHEPSLSDLYAAYAAYCQSSQLACTSESFQSWLAMTTDLKYAGSGEFEFISNIDEFVFPE
jgi:hypothetical protein